MSYLNVQKFYITKTLVNIPKMKIWRKSLLKTSSICFNFLFLFEIYIIICDNIIIKSDKK
jgi:hypothetical protein